MSVHRSHDIEYSKLCVRVSTHRSTLIAHCLPLSRAHNRGKRIGFKSRAADEGAVDVRTR